MFYQGQSVKKKNQLIEPFYLTGHFLAYAKFSWTLPLRVS